MNESDPWGQDLTRTISPNYDNAAESAVEREIQMLPENQVSASEDLAAQRAYVDQKTRAGAQPTWVVVDAFIRGIRHLGYKSTGTALDELIDNSIQAGAENVHVVFNYSENSNQPSSIAIIDDGHGMDPSMLPFAVMWGGTHREATSVQGRQGMGRFGFGLPSASVSQGQCFTVYSKTEDRSWYQITVDLEDLPNGQNLNGQGLASVPAPTLAALPQWISEYMALKLDDAVDHGTVVLLDKLDHLSWVTTTALERNLLQHFGVVYRNFLREVNIVVNGKRVDPIDPLFTTPGYRFYDLDEDRAIPLEPLEIVVKDKDSREDLGVIYVRLAHLPWTFARTNKNALGEGKLNARNPIMREHNGFIFMREGRQIDVVTKSPKGWPSFQNNDRFWKVEINFPASLDEEFSVTTSKQQIVPSDRIWDILDKAGLKWAISQMKRDLAEERTKVEAAVDDTPGPRPSEQIMAETGPRKPRSQRREEEAKRLFEQDVQRVVRETGRAPERVRSELEVELKGNPYKVIEERLPGAPFFRVEQSGGQTRLFLNTAHPFYANIYAGPESTLRLRSNLELLLFVIGECRLDTTSERQEIYDEEIQMWSILLKSKIGDLNRKFDIEDLLAEIDERRDDEREEIEDVQMTDTIEA